MPVYYLTKNSWKRLFSCLKEIYDTYVLKEYNGKLSYHLLADEDISTYDEIIYNKIRAVQPIKSFFQVFAENVSKTVKKTRKRIIIGVKACDINALEALDKMFLEGEYVDEFYKEKRDNTILIGCDCTMPDNNCFCTVLGNNPFIEKGVDLTLAQVHDGFVIQSDSDKGQGLIDENRNIFGGEIKENLNEERDKLRKNTTNAVKSINEKFNLKPQFWKNLSKYYDSNAWKKESETCVECHGCTNVCPSCYCFLLADLPGRKEFNRMKYQDSCQSSGYARVAGGATPRPELFERFRNKYMCKFDYRLNTIGLVSCTGCGRCIDACQGDIDIRKVVTAVLKR